MIGVAVAQGLDVQGRAPHAWVKTVSKVIITPDGKIKRGGQAVDDMGRSLPTLCANIVLDPPSGDSHLWRGQMKNRDIRERGGMDNIAELERRITAALMRIGDGVERLSAAHAETEQDITDQGVPDQGAPVATLADGVAEAEIARLNEALDEERMLAAQLNERLRVVRDQDAQARQDLEIEVGRLMKLLDGQGLEMQRLKKTVVGLREQLRLMTEAQAEGRVEPHLINKAMLTELETLRALRAAEAAELDELIAALDPLAGPRAEVATDA